MPSTILTRRRFLQLAGSAFALSSLPSVLRARPSAAPDTVSILHTTDLHGHILPTSTYEGIPDVGGLARCATRVAQWRAQNPHSLLVDAGDLYQGTEAGYRTQGRIMTDCLNHLDYDAWVLGNHEFDWGTDVVRERILSSRMPVLAANAIFDGKCPLLHPPSPGEGRASPWVLRAVNGYRIGLIGAITPGMPNWFLPELLQGFEATDPVPAVRKAIDQLLPEKPDAIILVAHMGVGRFSRQDDAANRLFGIAAACPEIDAIIAGHTHQDNPNDRVDGIIYTQAHYHGIHVGRLDLHFDPDTRKLLHAQPMTSHMDGTVALDPSILSLAGPDLEESTRVMATEVGTLASPLGITNAPGQPSDTERLIAASMLEGLHRRGHAVDAVLHGLLFQREPVAEGTKTIRDMWGIIPFENYIVTMEVTRSQLVAILEEAYAQSSLRSLVGDLTPTVEGPRRSTRVVSLSDKTGAGIPEGPRFRIALNSYDAAGGGARLPVLRDILREPETRRQLLPYQSRALLIEYFQHHTPVRLEELPG